MGTTEIDLSKSTMLTRFILDGAPITHSLTVGDYTLKQTSSRQFATIGCQVLTPTIMDKIRNFITKHSKPTVKKKSTSKVKESYLNIK